MVGLVSKSPKDPALKRVPDERYYIPFDLSLNYNPDYYKPGLYPFTAFDPDLHVKLPTINYTAFEFPTSPLLSQYHDIPKEQFCNRSENCEGRFCGCTNVIKVKLNAVVEIILIDLGKSCFIMGLVEFLFLIGTLKPFTTIVFHCTNPIL